MANPSLKNGFLSIANELVEQFALVNIPGNEMRIIWVVWRKTWGWKDGDRKKDWDWISYSQFEKLTGMKKRSVGKCLKTLVAKRLLLKSENRYKFNQNYNQWVVAKRLPPIVKRLSLVAKRLPPGSQLATKTGSQMATHKRNKETITKERDTHSREFIKPMKRNSFKYQENQPSDTFEDVVDMETGETVLDSKKPPKNKTVRLLQEYFLEKAKETTGLKPLVDAKGYFRILYATNTGGLKTEQIMKMIDDWFGSGRPDTELISLTRAFSNNQINEWKLKNYEKIN